MSDDLDRRLAIAKQLLKRTPEVLDVPLGLNFVPVPFEDSLSHWLDHASAVSAGSAFAPATLYVNIPFCARVCTYCLLSAENLPGKSDFQDYLEALGRHIALYAPHVQSLSFGTLHVGGGTPTLLNETQLERLFRDLQAFRLADGAPIGVEAHPGSTTEAKLRVMRDFGVTRISFGVESLTDAVLEAVNRGDQSTPKLRRAIEATRKLGMSVNIDLLAGLPEETGASWEQTLRETLELEPDSLSVNRYLAENSELAKFGFGADQQETQRVNHMLSFADQYIREHAPPRWPEEPLLTPGFGTQYVWDRSTNARRYFQDDMIGPVSTLALGAGALGHVFARNFNVPQGGPREYARHILEGGAPPMLHATIDERFEAAFFAAEHATKGGVSAREYSRIFKQPLSRLFNRELRFLVEQGLLEARGETLATRSPSDLDFLQLLTFLSNDVTMLEAHARRLDVPPPQRRSDVELQDAEHVEAWVKTRAAQGVTDVVVDLGAGVDANLATRLAQAAKRNKLRLEVISEGDRVSAQYRMLEAQLPPSMLWVRLSIRASRAGRGASTLASSTSGIS